MPETPYIYQDAAVAFLDVLGFEDKLSSFEQQAIQYNEDNNLFFSEGVNEFINTFKFGVGALENENFNYYLFSDNICITLDYSGEPNRLIDILITINNLFIHFAQKGYFLRGGIDTGKFVDVIEKDQKNKIAVGAPLAFAYKLEQNVAVYPRIVISEKFKILLDRFSESKTLTPDSITKKDLLIKKHCEVFYLNVFFNLINNENKIPILESLKNSIEKNLSSNSKNEKVAIKYEWLAEEFNSFINKYLEELLFLETESPEDAELNKIKSLKIIYHAH